MDSFFGIGIFELFLIAVIALVVLGPERLPGAMRTIADYMRQIRTVSSEFTSQFSEEIKMLEEMDPRRMVSDVLDPAKTPDSARAATAKAAPAARPATPSTPAKATTTPPAGDQNSILPPAGATPAAENPPASAASTGDAAARAGASSAPSETATSASAEDVR